MRSMLLALVLGAGASFSTPANAAPSEDSREKAKGLYDEGRKAYRRGDMKVAVDRFEAAYDLTENPIILFNIGLAYSRLYETSNELEHLRKAKVVLDNFSLELQRDPSLGEFAELDSLIAEIAKQIEDAEEQGAGSGSEGSAGTPEGPEVGDSEPPPGASAPATVDTGRKLRLTGIGLLAGGGALGIGAAVGAIVSQKRYFAEVDALDTAEEDAEAAGCPDASNPQCDEFVLLQDELAARANAYRRNIGVFAGGLGGAAIVSLATGGALLGIGLKRRETPATASVQVVPGWGSVSIQGRF